MKKVKKICCALSLGIGLALLLTVLVLGYHQTAYAAEVGNNNNNNAPTTQEGTGPGGPEGPDGTAGPDGPGGPEGADGPEGTGNGSSFYFGYNNENGEVSGTIKILLALTVISLAPSILIMMTSFTRIIIVLHFVRNAIGTQTAPPNQVLVGLALFLTLFLMYPVFGEINEVAIKPLDAGEITQEEAFQAGLQPIRNFMYPEIHADDITLMCDIAGLEAPNNLAEMDELPIRVIIPSFILSELRTAFIIGFFIYIPFIVIDMVVASVLMSMGMMMLPPTTISLPFKILLFVLADGWNLVIGNVIRTFQ